LIIPLRKRTASDKKAESDKELTPKKSPSDPKERLVMVGMTFIALVDSAESDVSFDHVLVAKLHEHAASSSADVIMETKATGSTGSIDTLKWIPKVPPFYIHPFPLLNLPIVFVDDECPELGGGE